MEESEPAEIAQISFYLAKRNQTFESVLNGEKDCTARKNATRFDFETDGATCRFHYFESTSPKSNPPWLDFVNDKVPPGQQLAFAAQSQSPNGILLINIDERVFAATFGRSAASYLEDTAF